MELALLNRGLVNGSEISMDSQRCLLKDVHAAMKLQLSIKTAIKSIVCYCPLWNYCELK